MNEKLTPFSRVKDVHMKNGHLQEDRMLSDIGSIAPNNIVGAVVREEDSGKVYTRYTMVEEDGYEPFAKKLDSS